jgi:putative SOS response-associated peptidase YedK
VPRFLRFNNARNSRSEFQQWMLGMPNEAAAMMKPYAGEIEAWEVGSEVGNVKNNRPELMERAGLL